MFFFQTLYLQRVLGFGPLTTGLSFLPFSGSMAIGSGLMGRLPDRVDPRLPIVLGCGLAVVGLWLMSGLTPDSSYGADVLPALIATGLGLGLAFVPISGWGPATPRSATAGWLSGLMITAQQIGGAIGIAALITVATDHTSRALHAGTPVASALSAGFQAAFHAESGIIGAAAVLALVLLRRGEAARAGRVGEVAMSSH